MKVKNIKSTRKQKDNIFKIILLLVIAILGLFIFNFDKISEKAPPRYKGALEKINDIIFGKIQIVEIKGNNIVTKDEILATIYKNDVLTDDLILLNSTLKIKKSLLGHPLIKKVNIKRFLPNKMVIYIKEKEIVAKVYNIEQKNFEFVQDNGFSLPFYTSRIRLPLLIGNFQPKDFADFYHKLVKNRKSSILINNLSDVICIFGFRFDIVLNRKILVNLPEEDVNLALDLLENLIQENHALEKNIKRIDLRIKGKIFIEYFEKGETHRYTPIDKIVTMEFK